MTINLTTDSPSHGILTMVTVTRVSGTVFLVPAAATYHYDKGVRFCLLLHT